MIELWFNCGLTRFISFSLDVTDHFLCYTTRETHLFLTCTLCDVLCWWSDLKEHFIIVLLAPAGVGRRHCLVYPKRLVASQE